MADDPSPSGGPSDAAARPVPPSTPPGGVPTVAWVPTPDRYVRIAWDIAPPWRTPELPGRLELVDQTRLPGEQTARRCESLWDVREAIRELAVRGAPAIGVAAAYGLVLAAQGLPNDAPCSLAAPAAFLRAARPTAVNLAWAVDRCMSRIAGVTDAHEAIHRLFAEAKAIHAEDEAACAAMGRHGATLLREGGTYLTHCNTGRFAATGIGTALGVLVTGHAWGLRPTVFAGEVRPLLQGARLTAFELRERGIEGRLLPDSAAGSLLASGRIDGVFVGADRIARNGDTANKIGTYPLAVLARENGVPFHVVAPTSTIDRSIADGASIPIEERDGDEVRSFAGRAVAPAGFPVHNPAFDVTPARLISGIVTERGIARPPFDRSL